MNNANILLEITKNTIYDPDFIKTKVNIAYRDLTNQRKEQIEKIISESNIEKSIVVPLRSVSTPSILHYYLFEKMKEVFQCDFDVHVFEQLQTKKPDMAGMLMAMNQSGIDTRSPKFKLSIMSDYRKESKNDRLVFVFGKVFRPITSFDTWSLIERIFFTTLFAHDRQATFLLVGQNEANHYEAMFSFVELLIDEPLRVIPLYLPELDFASGNQILMADDDSDLIYRKLADNVRVLEQKSRQVQFLSDMYRFFVYREEDRRAELSELEKQFETRSVDEITKTLADNLHRYMKTKWL